MVTGQQVESQLSLDNSWFLPGKTVEAMRDSRYRHPANAVAELIDNAIDANARRIEVLVKENRALVSERRHWRVDSLAVYDDGDGMDGKTLEEALRFGGRAGDSQLNRIGKYGIGLPTSSVSQSRRLEVWSWQQGVDMALYSYLDVDEVKKGLQPGPPSAVLRPLPSEWEELISGDGPNANHGTLIVWSKIDRINSRSRTLFTQLEREVGRIYRYFINSGDVSIRMAAFRANSLEPEHNEELKPNDPLYLMPNSATPEPWGEEPMFKELNTETYRISVDDREEMVEVTYSIVRQEALGTQARNPGSLDHGKDARHNMGVSIVREGREILLDDSFVRSGGRGNIPMNRWWGCEIRFKQGCDDLFGLDHNKQLAVALSNAARDILNSDENTDELYGELDVDDDPVYKIVGDIRNTTRSLLSEVEVMYARRRPEAGANQNSSGMVELQSPTDLEAASIMNQVTTDAISQGHEAPTPTDVDREEMAPADREKATQQYLTDEIGEDPDEATKEAHDIVRSGIPFMFKAVDLDGYQMFSVRSRAGVLYVNLNINHDLYEFLKLLNDKAVESANPEVRQAAVGVRTLLLAWARMEDHIELKEEQQRVQAIASRWGQHAGEVLRRVNQG